MISCIHSNVSALFNCSMLVGLTPNGYHLEQGEIEKTEAEQGELENTKKEQGADENDFFFIFVLYKIVVPILFGLISCAGAVGNLLVIYVILSQV